jgi:hypothetical protein
MATINTVDPSKSSKSSVFRSALNFEAAQPPNGLSYLPYGLVNGARTGKFLAFAESFMNVLYK